MLAIFVALVAASTWWITWPQRTAETFAKLSAEERYDEILRLMATPKDREFIERYSKRDPWMEEVQRKMTDRIVKEFGPKEAVELIPKKKHVPRVELLERSWSDILLGRAVFPIGIDTGCYVQRGWISFQPFDESD